jgi:hypothetical protein
MLVAGLLCFAYGFIRWLYYMPDAAYPTAAGAALIAMAAYDRAGER